MYSEFIAYIVNLLIYSECIKYIKGYLNVRFFGIPIPTSQLRLRAKGPPLIIMNSTVKSLSQFAARARAKGPP